MGACECVGIRDSRDFYFGFSTISAEYSAVLYPVLPLYVLQMIYRLPYYANCMHLTASHTHTFIWTVAILMGEKVGIRAYTTPIESPLSSPGTHHENSFCTGGCAWIVWVCGRWSSTSESKITEIAIVAYLTLVNDNALWIWQIDSLPFQIINRLCAMVWSKCSVVGGPSSWIIDMPPMMICTNAYTVTPITATTATVTVTLKYVHKLHMRALCVLASVTSVTVWLSLGGWRETITSARSTMTDTHCARFAFTSYDSLDN